VRKLKALYGAIVEFVIQIRGGYAEGQLKEELNRTLQAGQHVIEAVKGVKHLRKNLTRFMRSDNVHIRKEYDKLRRLIVSMFRAIEQVRHSEDRQTAALSLNNEKLKVEQKTEAILNGLDDLIRSHHINVTMATSLMNDITYCRETCWDLLQAGSTLFSPTDRDEKMAIRSVTLDAHEIAEIMQSKDQEPAP